MWKPYTRCLAVILGFSLAGGSWGQGERGAILFESWSGIQGAQIESLYLDLRWPDAPDGREQRSSFEGQPGRGNQYGQRVRGYVYPPQSGQYQFWIASDNNGMLWLSSDADPALAIPIASVIGNTGARVYDAQPNQQSETFTLQADQAYYIEAIQKEAGGGDHISVAWTGPGIGETPQVIEGAYLAPYIAPTDYLATDPKPADGSLGAKNAFLIWKPSPLAARQEVYFGTEATPGPDQKVADKSGKDTVAILGVKLISDQTYFWRVDTVDAAGGTHTGDTWSFTAKPLAAYNPTPAHGARWLPANRVILEWKAGAQAALHRVYLSSDSAAVKAADAAALLGESPATVALPGMLDPGVTYYWRVDEIAADGAVQEGPVWDFTTWAPAGARGQYFAGSLEEDPTLERLDPTIDFSWKDGAPAEGLPANGFSVRWTADLAVPQSGDYAFQTLTDGGVRLWLDGRLLIDEFFDAPENPVGRQRVRLDADDVYALTMEYYENSDNAEAHLLWEYWAEPDTVLQQVVPEGPLHPPARAGAPWPPKGDSGVDPTSDLTWNPGTQATGYDVYLGEDADVVTNATPDSVGIYQGHQVGTTFSPSLKGGQSYFWRVDTITTAMPDSPLPGVVWEFTTADYVIVDNFETYGRTEDDNPVWMTWSDGFATGQSGSVAGYDYPPYVETFITQGGLQALPLRYDNTGNASFAPGSLSSEVSREFSPTLDLTAQGGAKLVLYFRGQATNQVADTDRLYLGLEDGIGNQAWVFDAQSTRRYLQSTWQAWEIDLSDFVGVNLKALKAVTIGVGNRTAPVVGLHGTILIDSIAVLP